MATINLCNPRSCSVYKKCKQKKNPFKGNKCCNTYEIYIGQDNKTGKGNMSEVLFSETRIDVECIDSETPSFWGFEIDRKWLIAKLYFFDKREIREIMDIAQCSKQYVHRVIRQCKVHLIMVTKKGRRKNG